MKSILELMETMEFNLPVLPLVANVCLSCVASAVLFNIIPKFKEMFISAGLSGVDMNKLSQQPKGIVQGSQSSGGKTEKPVLYVFYLAVRYTCPKYPVSVIA